MNYGIKPMDFSEARKEAFLGDIDSLDVHSKPVQTFTTLPKASSTELQALVDLPSNLIKLSPIETIIVQHAASNKTPKMIATSLGLPTSAVHRVLANKDVEAYLDELVKARNKAIEAYLPGLLMDIVEAKLEAIEADPEKTLADASKRDLADIAKMISEMTQKSQVSDISKQDGVTAFYQQLNIIANAQ